jgi:hypothetical protein
MMKALCTSETSANFTGHGSMCRDTVIYTIRVFDNRVLRRIWGPKRGQVTGGSEARHGLYTSPNITRIIKYCSMRWTGHTERMRVTTN